MVSLLLATPVTFLALAICARAQVVTTSVTDTIYRADGTPAGGTVIVSWPAFTTPSGQSVAAGSTSATIGASGVLSVQLAPNAGAMPFGTYYTVVYHLDDGSVNREYWVVPASSSPVRIGAIRSTVLPTSVAMQTVSKSYVDTAIAAAVSGHPLDASNPYVLKSGDIMTGPLVLSGDPTAAAQAATKNYIDTFTPQAFTAGTITATTLNATTINGSITASQLPLFQASGAAHAPGAVPDPGATAGATRFLREDGAWAAPLGGTTGSSSAGAGIPSGATADFDFLQGSGSVLPDKSGNSNNGALGTGAAAPSWTSQGLYFPAGSNVALPASLNNTQTLFAAVYINPILTAYQTNIDWPAIVTSSTGNTGMNLVLFLKDTSGAFYDNVYTPGIFNGDIVTGSNLRLSGFHVFAYVMGSSSSGSVDHLYVDGVEVGSYLSQGVSANAQTSGNLFLGASGAGLWTGGVDETMYRVRTYASALSTTDVQAVSVAIRAEVAARGVATSPQPTPLGGPLLHAIGDSITAGLGVSTPWPSLLALSGNQSYTVMNWGIPSLKMIEAVGSEPNRAAKSCRTSTGSPSIAIIHLGTNDFSAGAPTAGKVFADMAGEIQALKHEGCTVFAATMLSRTGNDSSGNSYDAGKNAYDALILQQAKTAGADGVIDFAANPLVGADGATASATYFQADHTHPTQAGQQLLANAASNVLNYYFGYTLANPNVVTASTYTLASGDGAVTAAPTANAAWTMPDCTGPSGATYTISNPQSAFTLTIAGHANQPINGLATPVTIPTNTTVTLHDVPNPKNVSGCHWVM